MTEAQLLLFDLDAPSSSRTRRYETSADSESARIRPKRRIIRHDV